MRAFGPPEVLRLEEVDTPVPGPGEVLIRVHAVSVNRTLDLAVRAGTYPARVTLPRKLPCPGDRLELDFRRVERSPRMRKSRFTESQIVAILVNRAPHPSAAKVLINWLLTQGAQAAWAKELQTNSRFAGVEPGDPHAIVPMGLSLTQIDAEELLPELIKTQDLAKQLIK